MDIIIYTNHREDRYQDIFDFNETDKTITFSKINELNSENAYASYTYYKKNILGFSLTEIKKKSHDSLNYIPMGHPHVELSAYLMKHTTMTPIEKINVENLLKCVPISHIYIFKDSTLIKDLQKNVDNVFLLENNQLICWDNSKPNNYTKER